MEESRMNQNIYQEQSESEIDFIALAKRFWEKRKFIVCCIAICTALGLFVAISTPKKYSAGCLFVPQTGAKSASGSLSSLASLAGINLNNMGQSGPVLSPTLYPDIANNFDYRMELIHAKVLNFSDIKEPVSLYDYLTDPQYRHFSLLGTVKKYTVGLPFVILGAIQGKPKDITVPSSFSGPAPRAVTAKEYSVIKDMGLFLKVDVDAKKGFLTLSATMPEPLPAAQFAQCAYDLLQKYVVDFKTNKAKDTYNYLLKQRDEAKLVFEEKQKAYAEFEDANRLLSTATAKARREKVANEYMLANQLYSELEKQLLQADLQTKEDTPLLTAVTPISVPYKSSGTSRMKILFMWIFFGVFIGCGSVFGLDWLKEQGIDWPKGWE